MNRPVKYGILAGVGALGMYFLDPDRGRRRRTMLTDSLVHREYESRKFAGRFYRDLRHRTGGAVAEMRSAFRHEEATDDALLNRVRSAIGRTISRPHALELRVEDGHVEVGGCIMSWEAEGLRRMIETVRGVKEASMCVQTVEGPKPGATVPEQSRGFFGNQWPPTARVLTGGAGLALMMAGILRRRPLASGSAIVGAMMLARSLANMPLRRLPGAGIHIEKTIHVRAPRDEVFAFWSKPENYARVFSHVEAVQPEGDGTFRWRVTGPAGMPLSWTGRITDQVPGRKIEWHSSPGAAIENHGCIRLDDEGDGRTRVHVRLEYKPPAGLLGHSVATLLGIDPRNAMHHDFVQLQSLLERGFTRAHGHRVSAAELGLAAAKETTQPAAS